MTRYVVDTDTLTLFFLMRPVVMARMHEHAADEIVTSSVTVGEQLSGWLHAIRVARTPVETETASRRLTEAVRRLGTWDAPPFTAVAVERFTDLTRRKLNVGGNDLRIAAIALEAGAVVVTRNLRDFRRVPGLRCEDWSV